MKSHIKDFLGTEVPEVNFGALKDKTLNAIREYEEKREQQNIYFMSTIGFNLLVVLLALNFYSFFQEIGSLYPFVAKEGVFFWQSFIRMSLAALDNILIIFLNLSLILLLNRRFLGLRRVYKFARNRLFSLAQFFLRVPGSAWHTLRRS